MFKKLNRIHRLKSAFLMLVPLCVYSSVSAQIGEIFNGNIINNIPWKWTLSQNWSSSSNSWEDTSTIVYTKGNTGTPSEIISRIKDSGGLWTDLEKIVLTYANEKIKTGKVYTYIADSSKYAATPLLSLNYSWDGDLPSKVTGELPFTTLMNLTPSALSTYAPLFSEIKFLFELQNTIKNGKITEGVSKVKLSINPLIYSVFLTLMKSSDSTMSLFDNLPLDTNWSNQIKTTYMYNTNSEIQLEQSWSASDSTWIPNKKDSLAYNGSTKPLIFHFDYNSTKQQWDLKSKDSTLVNQDKTPNQTISMDLNGATWQNSSRSLYFYSEYVSSAIRFQSVRQIQPNLMTAKIYSFPDHPNLDLVLNGTSKISIIVTDLKGRTLYKVINLTCNAGSYSYTIPVSACGSYICMVRSDKTISTIPFSIVK